MHLISTIVLIFFAAACSAGEDGVLLGGIDAKSISAISVVSGGQEVVVARKGGKWEAVKPDDLTIREGGPNAFINLLNTKIIRTFPASDARRVGLDKPTARVELTAGDDKWLIEFGTRTADRTSCYVRHRVVIAEIDADALDWIERGTRVFELAPVFKFDRQQATEFVVEGGRVRYHASKTPSGEWLLMAPIPAPASAARVAALLDALDGLNTAHELKDIPNKRFEKPYRRITLIVGGETKELLIGAPASKDGSRFAKAGDTIFIIKQSVITKIDAELLSPLVVNVVPAQVAAINITDEQGRHTLRLTDDGWEWNGESVDSNAAAVFVEECGSVQAEAFLSYDTDDLAHYALTSPALDVEIMRVEKLPVNFRVGRGADKKELFRAGLSPDGRYFCATGGNVPAVFLIKIEKVEVLRKLMDELSGRKTK